MSEIPLYRQIAASIRQDILAGRLKPGARLPPVRRMAEQWNCTLGTIQHAYQELARQGLVTSRAGQGTRVATQLRSSPPETPLRRAALVNRAESFFLEALAAGYQLDEIDAAVRMATDRWRAIEEAHPVPPGSLGGIIALAEGRSDLAGCHLWDAESSEYNTPFVRRVLPGKRVALATLAQRRLGLILPPGNPARMLSLADLARPGLRFVNRQPGSGTRVWLDVSLARLGIQPQDIQGYANERRTHSEVARAIAEREADVGIGLEASAAAYGLDFILLIRERYDLIIPAPVFEQEPVQRFLAWLQSPAAKKAIESLSGYEAQITGRITWIE